MDPAAHGTSPGRALDARAPRRSHHDRDWDAIIVPREIKERLLAQALLVLQHGASSRCSRAYRMA
jgi:hypothetical protein